MACRKGEGFCRGSLVSRVRCVECGLERIAVWRCRECGEFFCDDCTAVHRGCERVREVRSDVA